MQKQKQEKGEKSGGGNGGEEKSVLSDPAKIRVQKDISELDLPNTIKVTFPDTNDLMNFDIIIRPNEGFYLNGQFQFKCNVASNFPIQPPKLKCLQKIYHPNIDLEGNICLNILREDWSPVLTINSILIGLQFLFLDPNPNDPLNKDAANDLKRDQNNFKRNVYNAMRGGRVGDEIFDNVLR